MEADKEIKPEKAEETQKFNLGDSYFEDEAVYPEYTEQEAVKIIIPTEENLQTTDSSVQEQITALLNKDSGVKNSILLDSSDLKLNNVYTYLYNHKEVIKNILIKK